MKKMKKKLWLIAAVFAAVALLFTFNACGGGNDDPGTTAGPDEDDPDNGDPNNTPTFKGFTFNYNEGADYLIVWDEDGALDPVTGNPIPDYATEWLGSWTPYDTLERKDYGGGAAAPAAPNYLKYKYVVIEFKEELLEDQKVEMLMRDSWYRNGADDGVRAIIAAEKGKNFYCETTGIEADAFTTTGFFIGLATWSKAVWNNDLGENGGWDPVDDEDYQFIDNVSRVYFTNNATNSNDDALLYTKIIADIK